MAGKLGFFPRTSIRQNDIDHVRHDCYVPDQQSTTQQCHTLKEFPDFQRQQERPRNRGHPLSPCAAMPKTVGLGKAKHCVGEGQACRRPQLGVGDVVREIEEHLRDTPVGADVKQREQTLGIEPGILVHQQDGADPHQAYEHTFKEFEAGDSLEHAPLTMWWFWCEMAHAEAYFGGYHAKPRAPYTAVSAPAGWLLGHSPCQSVRIWTDINVTYILKGFQIDDHHVVIRGTRYERSFSVGLHENSGVAVP